MKFSIQMKTPDVIDDAICMAVLNELGEVCDEDERYELTQTAKEICKKWFRWGEFVTLEVDTEQETCIVKEVG